MLVSQICIDESRKEFKIYNSESREVTVHALAHAEIVRTLTASERAYTQQQYLGCNNCVDYKNTDLDISGRPWELHAKNFEIHFTCLREKLQTAIPGRVSVLQGRKYVLMFDTDTGSAIASARTQESEALTLARAAQLVRKEIHSVGYLIRDCQERSVPVMLKALVGMILKGPDVKEGSADRGLQD